MNSLAALAGRILLALIFLLSGIDKVVHYAQTLGYMQKAGLPFPEVLLIASIIIEIGGWVPGHAGRKTSSAPAALGLRMISVPLGLAKPGGWQRATDSLHEERGPTSRCP